VWVYFRGQRMLLKEFSLLISKDAAGVSRRLLKGQSREYIADRAGCYDALALAA
jgi:hypothetical protein